MDVHLKTHTHPGAVLCACNLSRRVSVISSSTCSTHRVPCQPGLHSRPKTKSETEQQHAQPFIQPHHNGILRNPGSCCHLLCAVGRSMERHPFPGSDGSIWPLRFLQGSDCSNIRKKLAFVCLHTYLFAYLLSIYIFFFWWVRVLMCTRVWPWSCYVAKVEPSWFSYLSFLDVAITGVYHLVYVCVACMWVYRHTCSCTRMQRPDRTSVSSTITFSFIALSQGLLSFSG